MLLLWGMDEDSWRHRACAVAGRNLSLAEWERYLPEHREYEQTCDNYPAHPSAIKSRIHQAERLWAEGNVKQARTALCQAMEWINAMPARHDRIDLLWTSLAALPDDHAIRPTLEQQIAAWMEQLPDANRAYGTERMSTNGEAK